MAKNFKRQLEFMPHSLQNPNRFSNHFEFGIGGMNT